MFAGSAVGVVLARLGVRQAFGVLGGANFLPAQAMHDAGCAFLPARQESAAVAMAAGYARATGGLGVCSIHYGPAVVSALLGITEAAHRDSPVLIITGYLPTETAQAEHRMLELAGATVHTVRGVETLVPDVVDAAQAALDGNAPVVLMVPVALQGTLYDETTMPPVELRRPAPPATPPSADALASATDLLAEASGILLLAGAGAVRAGALPALHALADDLGALLCTTVRAHGAFNNSPWSLGSAGAFGHPLLPELAATADVVIAVGASLNDWTTGHGALIGPHQRIIRIDVDADRIEQAPATTVGIVADAQLTAEALRTEVRARGLPPTGIRRRACASGWPPRPGRAGSRASSPTVRTSTRARSPWPSTIC